MQYKLLYVSLIVLISTGCQSSKYTIFTAWPEELSDFKLIHEYISVKRILNDNKEIRKEYEYILSFLEELTAVHKANIKNSILKNADYIGRHPVMVDGRLEFENALTRLVWDENKEEFVKFADIDVVTEITDSIMAMDVYNKFVEDWFLKTGETLRNKWDIGKEIDAIVKLIQSAKA
jgi:hypothetical protein